VKTFLERANALILACMFGVTVVTVIFRSVLGISAGWSEELAQLTFILLVFIGAATVMEDEGHIRINTLVDRLSPGRQRAVRIISRVLMIAFLVPFAQGAWQNAVSNWEVDLGTIETIKVGHMYLVLMLASLVMMAYLIINIVRDARGTYRRAGTLDSTI
jgi:TRAP-type C4-dicarboxylate transport system permease small subunit